MFVNSSAYLLGRKANVATEFLDLQSSVWAFIGVNYARRNQVELDFMRLKDQI